ncbi:hypothetical protein K458DRAFT_160946 [Lentithecium fluviatile CBS 122367]|uniref:Uncharacterized protein n=1 Tax=Lentithecium fluviatile CBS 122367 TaxID=1168545 RepID=A0A6G1IHM6_9PLEO|nr:hypothetical protein K458DRAFT_160946 [Lentithecium fluviatile CBS 122367]
MRGYDKTYPLSKAPSKSPRSYTYSETSININETSHLNITMAIESRSRKKTVYRVVQRSDGVIVEKPRYTPSPGPPTPTRSIPLSEKRAQATELAPGYIKPARSDRDTRMAEDLRGVGTFVGGEPTQPRDGYYRAFERGRGGYNEVFGRGLDPVRRFLEKPGPWSTHNRRANIILHQECVDGRSSRSQTTTQGYSLSRDEAEWVSYGVESAASRW